MEKLKLVRAKITNSYDGHRRRAGSVFTVRADANEHWFEDVGPAPQDAELPPQVPAQASPRGKSFIAIMQQLAPNKEPAKTLVSEQPQMTLAEAQAQAIVPQDDLV